MLKEGRRTPDRQGEGERHVPDQKAVSQDGAAAAAAACTEGGDQALSDPKSRSELRRHAAQLGQPPPEWDAAGNIKPISDAHLAWLRQYVADHTEGYHIQLARSEVQALLARLDHAEQQLEAMDKNWRRIRKEHTLSAVVIEILSIRHPNDEGLHPEVAWALAVMKGVLALPDDTREGGNDLAASKG